MLTKPLVYVSECPSTNNLIKTYLPEGSLAMGLYTFNQTKGKGQYGNSWLCEPDLNIAYSLMISAQLIPYSDQLFNFRTAGIIHQFIANLTEHETKIKWPNDIILRNKKISGILLEKVTQKSMTFFIVGIGLNVLQTDFSNLPNASSLLLQSGKAYDMEILAERLHHTLIEELSRKQSESQILSYYNDHLFRKGQVSLFQINNIRQNGIIKRVFSDGYLEVELEHDGVQRFFHKQIELLY